MSSPELDYLGHLARESAMFARAAGLAAPDAPVPSCPDWNADDLLWHLAEVQWFWGTIVREGVLTSAQAKGLERPERPSDRAGLLAFFTTVSSELGKVLAAAAPGTPAWTWSDDHTVGFIRRRQAHEALIHRVDAELTAGDRTAMDPQLSADGIDEVLRIMYGGDVPSWGAFEPDERRTVRIRATDTGDSWLVRLGRFTGTDPADSRSYDQPGIQVPQADPGIEALATVSGPAADLDCWLWKRPPMTLLDQYGDRPALAALDSVIAEGIS
jgi:uncharacterized protein (TIGR03083 family)